MRAIEIMNFTGGGKAPALSIHSRGGFYARRGLQPGRNLLGSASGLAGQSGTDGEGFPTLGRGCGGISGEATFGF